MESPFSDKQKLYWALQIGGWSIYIIINYLALPLFASPLPYSGTYYFFSFVIGIAVTHVYKIYIKKHRWLKRPTPRLLFNIFFGSALLTIVYFFILGVFDLFLLLLSTGFKLNTEGVVLNDSYWAFLVLSLFNVYAVFIIWSVLYFVFQYIEGYREARYMQLQTQNQLQDATLRNLRQQLNPHFLFNALNCIRALTLTDPSKARDAITLLSDLLRYSLNAGETNFVSLSQELAVVRDYLQIEKIRFGERLKFNIEVSQKACNANIPTLMVMTLVENAIKHGISKRKDGGEVIIYAEFENDQIVISVTNTGELNVKDNSQGIGLNNIRQRLDLLYADATLAIEESNNEFSPIVKTTLKIPYAHEDQSSDS